MPSVDGAMGTDLDFVNLRELRELARSRVASAAFDYVDGGSCDEASVLGNREAFSHWRLLHRVLRDVSACSPATTVLGSRVDFPVLVAPTAFHKLMHPDGEAATARGAHAAGTLMVASTLSTTRLEDVAAASPGPKWFQLYVYKDRKLTESLVRRAEAAGYEALVLTVDSAVWGRRERDVRNGFTLPEPLTLANFTEDATMRLPSQAGSDGLAAYVASQLDPSLTWRDVEWLTELTDLPVLVKGIVHPEDARDAVRHGAAGVIVSNHGGRQLDAGVPTIHALPGVVEAVADENRRRGADEPRSSSTVEGQCEVFVDGGVCRGTHVVTALALGARAVLVGRPVLWALAVGGADGVTRALSTLKEETVNALSLCGATCPDDVTRDLVQHVAW